jgi:hypothetical protein
MEKGSVSSKADLRLRLRLARNEGVEIEAVAEVGRPDRDDRPDGWTIRKDGCDLLRELAVHDQDLGVRLAEDVLEFRRRILDGDVDEDKTGAGGPEEDDAVLRQVARQDRDLRPFGCTCADERMANRLAAASSSRNDRRHRRQ